MTGEPTGDNASHTHTPASYTAGPVRRARRPPNRPPNRSRQRDHPTPSRPTDQRATRGERRRQATKRARERYLAEQRRLDAEAVDRWGDKVAHLPPMTPEQLNAVAQIFRRIDTRRANPPTPEHP